MHLILNLKRNFNKKKPLYFFTIIDNKRKNKIIDKLGIFNPLTNPKKILLNLEKLKFWLQNGTKIKNKKLIAIFSNILKKNV